MKGFTGTRWVDLGRAHGVIQSNCEGTNPSRHSGASTQPVARRGFFDWFTRTITTTTALIVWLAIGLFTVPANQALAQTTCANEGGPYTFYAGIRLPSGLAGGDCEVTEGVIDDADELLLIVTPLSSALSGRVRFAAKFEDKQIAPSSLKVDNQEANQSTDGRSALDYFGANSNGTHTAIGEVMLGGTVYRVTMEYTQTDTAIEVTSATITGGHFGGTVESTDHTAPAGYGVEIDQSSIDNSNVTDVSFGLRLAEFGSTYE